MKSQKEAGQFVNSLQKTKNYSSKKIRHLEIKPTYRTNFHGKNDPFAHRLKDFPSDLRWQDFVFIIDRFSSSGDLEMVTFTGGEPTLWPELEKALNFCHEKNIITALATNGTKIPKVLPYRLKVGLKTFFEGPPELRKKIQENIRALPQRIGFHYFFSENDGPEIIEEAVQIAKQKEGYIYFAPEFQTDLILANNFQSDFPGYKPSSKLKELWFYAAKLVEKELGKKLRFDWAAPEALFSAEEISQLKKENQFCSNCDFCPVGRFQMNPDGKTIYPCPFLAIGADISEYYGSTDLWENFFLPQKKKINLPHGGCPGIYTYAKNQKIA